MRIFTEARVQLAGDRGLSQGYISQARTLLGIMKSINGNLEVQYWNRILPDGTRIELRSIHGQDSIKITTIESGETYLTKAPYVTVAVDTSEYEPHSAFFSEEFTENISAIENFPTPPENHFALQNGIINTSYVRPTDKNGDRIGTMSCYTRSDTDEVVAFTGIPMDPNSWDEGFPEPFPTGHINYRGMFFKADIYDYVLDARVRNNRLYVAAGYPGGEWEAYFYYFDLDDYEEGEDNDLISFGSITSQNESIIQGDYEVEFDDGNWHYMFSLKFAPDLSQVSILSRQRMDDVDVGDAPGDVSGNNTRDSHDAHDVVALISTGNDGLFLEEFTYTTYPDEHLYQRVEEQNVFGKQISLETEIYAEWYEAGKFTTSNNVPGDTFTVSYSNEHLASTVGTIEAQINGTRNPTVNIGGTNYDIEDGLELEIESAPVLCSTDPDVYDVITSYYNYSLSVTEPSFGATDKSATYSFTWTQESWTVNGCTAVESAHAFKYSKRTGKTVNKPWMRYSDVEGDYTEKYTMVGDGYKVGFDYIDGVRYWITCRPESLGANTHTYSEEFRQIEVLNHPTMTNGNQDVLVTFSADAKAWFEDLLGDPLSYRYGSSTASGNLTYNLYMNDEIIMGSADSEQNPTNGTSTIEYDYILKDHLGGYKTTIFKNFQECTDYNGSNPEEVGMGARVFSGEPYRRTRFMGGDPKIGVWSEQRNWDLRFHEKRVMALTGDLVVNEEGQYTRYDVFEHWLHDNGNHETIRTHSEDKGVSEISPSLGQSLTIRGDTFHTARFKGAQSLSVGTDVTRYRIYDQDPSTFNPAAGIYFPIDEFSIIYGTWALDFNWDDYTPVMEYNFLQIRDHNGGVVQQIDEVQIPVDDTIDVYDPNESVFSYRLMLGYGS